MAEDHLDANLGISRRTLIKRGAIVGGAVWAAPAITSFGSRAIGQTTTGTPGDTNISFIAFNMTCGDGHTYRVKVEENSSGGWDCESGNTFETPGCTGSLLAQTGSADVCTNIAVNTNADGSVTVDLPTGCSFTGSAFVKCGGCCNTRTPSGNDETFAECAAVQEPC